MAGGTVLRMALTDDELAMLELERSWWKYPGVKETTIRRRLGISATRYYQNLNELIDRPDALAADPLTVRRLQRARGARRSERSVRRVGFEIGW